MQSCARWNDARRHQWIHPSDSGSYGDLGSLWWAPVLRSSFHSSSTCQHTHDVQAMTNGQEEYEQLACEVPWDRPSSS